MRHRMKTERNGKIKEHPLRYEIKIDVLKTRVHNSCCAGLPNIRNSKH
jgi:hypothetical protein